MKGKCLSSPLHSQVPALKRASAEQPGGQWWIKANSCDLTSGLMESMHGIWNEDVNLADGKVQELNQMYRDRQTSCNELGLKESRSLQNIKTQIQNKWDEVKHNMEFLSPGTIPTLVCCITTSPDMHHHCMHRINRCTTNIPGSS